MVDGARRAGLQIDDGTCVHAAIGAPAAADVRRQSDLAARRHSNVIWPLTGRQVELGVSDLVASNVEQRYLMGCILGCDGPLAIGGEGDMCDAVAQCNRIEYLHVGAPDREHADRAIGAIGNERQIACSIETEKPDGCLPTVTVAASFGGLALRSITWTLLSGTILSA